MYKTLYSPSLEFSHQSYILFLTGILRAGNLIDDMLYIGQRYFGFTVHSGNVLINAHQHRVRLLELGFQFTHGRGCFHKTESGSFLALWYRGAVQPCTDTIPVKVISRVDTEVFMLFDGKRQLIYC